MIVVFECNHFENDSLRKQKSYFFLITLLIHVPVFLIKINKYIYSFKRPSTNVFLLLSIALVPQKPEELTASNIYSKQMTLSWTFSDPSPGNTIYTINVYQATDDKGTEFILTKFLKTLGKSKCFLLLCITKLFSEWTGSGAIKLWPWYRAKKLR